MRRTTYDKATKIIKEIEMCDSFIELLKECPLSINGDTERDNTIISKHRTIAIVEDADFMSVCNYNIIKGILSKYISIEFVKTLCNSIEEYRKELENELDKLND